MTTLVLFAFLIGIVSGLRAMTAPAAVSWAAKVGMLSLSGTPLAFMGFAYTPYIFTVLAIAEIINDKLPTTPSRKVPPQFIVRILSGSLAGASLGAATQMLWLGLIVGALGAVAGMLGGAALRGKLAALFGKDLPAALLEDVITILLAFFAVTRF